MISNLHVLRGLAALGVVIYHTDFRLPGAQHTDFSGVAIFFVLSGFLMTYITRESAAGFMTARLTRIVPLYWIATVFTAIWVASGLNNPNYVFPLLFNWSYTDPMLIIQFFQKMLGHNLSLSHIVHSLLFLPSSTPPVVGVGWTLNLEMFFYALFWMALFISRLMAPLLVAVVLYALHLHHEDPACGLICATYGHDYVLFFVAGIACFYLWRGVEWLPPRARRWLVPIALLTLAFWPVSNLYGSANHDLHRWLPPSIVFSALVLHSAGMRSASTPLLTLGSASYALYLIHPLVVDFVRELGRAFPAIAPATTLLGLAVAVAASIGVAVVVHLWVEAPLLNAIRALTRAIAKSSWSRSWRATWHPSSTASTDGTARAEMNFDGKRVAAE